MAAVAATLACSGLGGPNAAGLEFLAANKDKAGVIELASGLQYKVLKTGSGDSHPTKSSPCLCHYHGTLVDGTVFDSSVDRGSPITFAPEQVIKGWTEAMGMMVEGDKWELYINSDLAYGDRGSPPKIGAGDTLIFTIEMLEIQGPKVPAQRCDAADPSAGCSDKEQAYIAKQQGKAAAELATEAERLEGMAANKMKPELVAWMQRRLAILRQLIAAADAKQEL